MIALPEDAQHTPSLALGQTGEMREKTDAGGPSPNAGVPVLGGSFLWEEKRPDDVLTPSDVPEEDRAIAELARTFIEEKVLPRMPELEHHDLDLLKRLMREAGELGLLGIEVPSAYGGSGLGRVSATAVVEAFAPAGGFAVTQAAHSGLATLPIALFGTPEQKDRYLPDLVTGARLAAYALTEPGYGSDALRGRTTARPANDGGYRLTGEKQWITNSGIADLWVVFAQLEGQGFTAFLVERDTPGLSTGSEYDKLGIRSSSTRPLILEDVYVPGDHLLGRPGRGHEIALSVLDVSRLNLGAGAVGSGKWLLAMAVDYAKGRIQFGRPIVEFGLIREKLARMQVRLWALETTVYRTAGLIDALGRTHPEIGEAGAAAEFALECAVVKVLGSEVLGGIVDETLQIHGGYGYMADYAVERAYRDARINRIFEGTNEINRLTIPETLLRRASRGRVPLAELRANLTRELGRFERPAFFDSGLDADAFSLSAAKKAFWLAASSALDRVSGGGNVTPEALEAEEEMLGSLADIAIAIYTAESALLRAKRIAGGPDRDKAPDPAGAPWAERMANLAMDEAMTTVAREGQRVISHATSGDTRMTTLSLMRRLTARTPRDDIAELRKVADGVTEAGGFVS